jgi:hypothetical protein
MNKQELPPTSKEALNRVELTVDQEEEKFPSLEAMIYEETKI